MSSSYTERFFGMGCGKYLFTKLLLLPSPCELFSYPSKSQVPTRFLFSSGQDVSLSCLIVEEPHTTEFPYIQNERFFSPPVNLVYVNLNPEGEKSFSFSKAVHEQSLHRCYSADTWTAKHVVVFQFLLLQISYKYLGIANDIATLNDSQIILKLHVKERITLRREN